MKRPLTLVPVLAAVVAIAAGCGTNSYNNGGGSAGGPSNLYGSAPSAKPASVGGARISTADDGLGTMLVDGQGRTLYLWKADAGRSSMCNGACAQGWPPVTTAGAPRAGGAVQSSLLGRTKRSDGATQVTYAGHPLYRFSGDTAAGQSSGQSSDAFGAPWFVVAPGGAAITRTA